MPRTTSGCMAPMEFRDPVGTLARTEVAEDGFGLTRSRGV